MFCKFLPFLTLIRFGEISGFSQTVELGWLSVCADELSVKACFHRPGKWVWVMGEGVPTARRGRFTATCPELSLGWLQDRVQSMVSIIHDLWWSMNSDWAPSIFQPFSHAHPIIILCCPHGQCPPQLKKSDIASVLTFLHRRKGGLSRSFLSMEVFCHVEVWNSKVKSAQIWYSSSVPHLLHRIPWFPQGILVRGWLTKLMFYVCGREGMMVANYSSILADVWPWIYFWFEIPQLHIKLLIVQVRVWHSQLFF